MTNWPGVLCFFLGASIQHRFDCASGAELSAGHVAARDAMVWAIICLSQRVWLAHNSSRDRSNLNGVLVMRDPKCNKIFRKCKSITISSGHPARGVVTWVMLTTPPSGWLPGHVGIDCRLYAEATTVAVDVLTVT